MAFTIKKEIGVRLLLEIPVCARKNNVCMRIKWSEISFESVCETKTPSMANDQE